MQTLTGILLFFSFFSAGAQTLKLSTADLYRQTFKIYKLSKEGKSLKTIVLCDSVINEYNGFPGSETYLGYIYNYLAEAAKQQGDISLARYSLELATRFFIPGSEELNYQIPVNLVSLDLEAGRFDRCLSNGLTLLGEKVFRLDPAKRGTLLNNLAAAALQSKKFNLTDSLFCCLFDLIHHKTAGAGFDTALTYRNFGRYKLATGHAEAAAIAIHRSLDLYQMQYGISHFQTAKSWHDLGNVFKRQNILDSAHFCYSKARNYFQTTDSVSSDKTYSNLKMDYENIYFELLQDEVDLQRIQALQQKGSQRVMELEKALRKIAEGITRFETILQVLISSESGFVLADKGRKLFETGIRVSIDLYLETGEIGYLKKTFFWSLQSGSVSLQARAGLEERMITDDSTRVRALRLYRLRDALDETIDRDSRTVQLQKYQMLKQQLESDHPESFLASEPGEFRIQLINRAIGRGHFICYHQLDSVIMVFELSHRKLSFSEIRLTDNLRNTLAGFTKSLSGPMSGNYHNGAVNEIHQEGVYLFQVLLKPFIVNEYSGELFIRPDGLIMDLPFEALVVDYTGDIGPGSPNEFRDLPFVIKNFQISYVSGIQPPSKGRFMPLHRKSFRILSCPDDRLAPEIRNEVEWLSGKLPHATLVDLGGNGFDLKTSLGKADLIHFAGHVRLDQDDAMRTIMGCSGQAQGAFQLSELLHINIESDLVFINGCESAQGVLNRGDGNLSPGLFFLLAGAGGVIEHRLKAPDISGSMLAREFYTHYPANQPAKALQKAKRNYLATCQPGLDHPHYWAGMVYTGPLTLNRSNLPGIILISVIGLGLFVAIGLIIRKRISR